MGKVHFRDSGCKWRFLAVAAAISAMVNGGEFQKGNVLLRIDPLDYQLAVTLAKARVIDSESLLKVAEEEAASAKEEWRLLSKDGSEKIVAWSNISEYFPIPGWKSWRVGVDITDLKTSLAQVKVLSGLLPICAQCKKIRDDNGYWEQIEKFIRDNSEADFSHSICPECVKMLYPGFGQKKK